MKKFLALFLAVLMVASLFAGCGSKTEAPAASGSESSAPAAFKLGGTGPLTGGAAIYGLACKNAATIAVEEINALGGVQFELNYQDDTHDAEKAVNAFNTLLDWGMQLSLGSVTSTPCVATAAETMAASVFALSPSASAPAVLDQGDNQFQMCFTDPNQGSASAQYISDKALATKVAVIWKNDDVYSKGIYDTFMAQAAKLGLEVVSDTTFMDGNDTDFSVQVADAKNAGAELVFLPIYYTPAAQILAEAKKQDFTATFFGVDGMDGILSLEGFDTSLAEGVILLTPFNADSSDAKTAAFVKKYQERFGDIPNQFAADTYDCVYAYAQALAAAGATTDMTAAQLNDLMKAQFTTMTFDGLTGEGMTWDANGAVTKSPKGCVITNGAYVAMD